MSQMKHSAKKILKRHREMRMEQVARDRREYYHGKRTKSAAHEETKTLTPQKARSLKRAQTAEGNFSPGRSLGFGSSLNSTGAQPMYESPGRST